MSAIATLDSLMERVIKEDARKYDLLADTRRMSVVADYDEEMQPTGGVILQLDPEMADKVKEVESFRLTDHALGQMATDLGIPMRYFRRMQEEAFPLFKRNVHHWMYEDPNRRMIRAYRNEGSIPTARAWLSDRYRRIDNIEIAKRLLPEFGRLDTEVSFYNAAITEEKFYLRALFPRITGDVKVGDAVQWGVQIRNSEVGSGSFAIESFVMRLACMNGLVVQKVLNARHIGKRLDDVLSDEAVEADDRAFWLAARDVLRASISEEEFRKVLRTLQQTTDGDTIVAPIAATERLAKTFSLTDGERDAVLLELAASGDMSRWGALNAITAAAKQSDSFDRQVEMEEIGWSLAEITQNEWSKIAVAA